MLNDETAELRMLRAKAFGRDGALSEIELARLHELEGWSSDPAAPAPVVERHVDSLTLTQRGSRHGSQRGSPRDETDPIPVVETPEPEETTSAAEEPPTAPPLESKSRHRWRFAVASAAILAAGVGVGWGIWGWNHAEFALAANHAEQRSVLEASGDYDPGSVRALSEQHGVVIWQAQLEAGEQRCVIVTAGETTHEGCGILDDSNAMSASASIAVPDGEDLAGQHLVAYLLRSTTGELLPGIQVFDPQNSGWEQQYSAAELETIDRFEAEGFTGESMHIFGYDGETPVWSAWTSEGTCLVVEADEGIVSDCMAEVLPDTELSITATMQGVETQYIVRSTMNRGQQLTIVKLPELAFAEYQDPIEFEAG